MVKKKGLWDNIHAKRKRGEAPTKKGEKGYPKTLDIADSVNSDTESALDFINENGTLPYELDGEIPITDARTRNKRRK